MGQHSGSRVIAGGLADISPQEQLFLYTRTHNSLKRTRQQQQQQHERSNDNLLTLIYIFFSFLLQLWLNAGHDGNRDYWSYVSQFVWVERRWVKKKDKTNRRIFGKVYLLSNYVLAVY